MKSTLNLEEYGVTELSYSECQSIDGGALSERVENLIFGFAKWLGTLATQDMRPEINPSDPNWVNFYYGKL
jgi:hypothetical protein